MRKFFTTLFLIFSIYSYGQFKKVSASLNQEIKIQQIALSDDYLMLIGHDIVDPSIQHYQTSNLYLYEISDQLTLESIRYTMGEYENAFDIKIHNDIIISTFDYGIAFYDFSEAPDYWFYSGTGFTQTRYDFGETAAQGNAFFSSSDHTLTAYDHSGTTPIKHRDFDLGSNIRDMVTTEMNEKVIATQNQKIYFVDYSDFNNFNTTSITPPKNVNKLTYNSLGTSSNFAITNYGDSASEEGFYVLDVESELIIDSLSIPPSITNIGEMTFNYYKGESCLFITHRKGFSVLSLSESGKLELLHNEEIPNLTHHKKSIAGSYNLNKEGFIIISDYENIYVYAEESYTLGVNSESASKKQALILNANGDKIGAIEYDATSQIKKVSVYTPSGKLIEESNFNPHQSENIKISKNLSSGIFLVNLHSTNESKTVKLLVE